MPRVELTARSLAEGAALVALSDISRVIDDWREVRIVGGHMVRLHTELHGVEPRERQTVDADLVGSVAAIGSPQLAGRLLGTSGLGYERVGGNRLVRNLGSDRQAVIDLLGPSRTSRVEHNVAAGAFSIDAFPGMHTALRREPVVVEINSSAFDATAAVALPDLIGALVIKSLAAAGSGRQRDRDDVEHLLRCAQRAGVELPPPNRRWLDFEQVAAYLHGPFVTGRSASTARRRLVLQVVPNDPRPDPFANL